MKIKSIKKVGRKPVYDISVKDVEHYILENGVASHNTGAYYSSQGIWIIGRQQDKDDTGLNGFNFVINIEKGRRVKEKSKIPITVNFKKGVDRYSGLLDIALEGGFIIKPKVGWYQVCDPVTKVPLPKSLREADTHTAEVWGPLLTSTEFKEFIKDKYKLAVVDMLQDETVDIDPIADEVD